MFSGPSSRLQPALDPYPEKTMKDSFGSHSTLKVGNREYRIARLAALEKKGIRLSRIDMPNADPAFVRVLAGLVRGRLSAPAPS